MKEFIRRNSFLIILLLVILVVFDIFSDYRSFLVFVFALVNLLIGLWVNRPWLERLTFFLALFAFLLALFMTRSAWLLLVVLLIFLIIFRIPTGNEFFDTGEVRLVPYSLSPKYVGVKLVEPQSLQRESVLKKPLQFRSNLEEPQAWDDINIVMFAGNSIIDLGNTNLPEQESIVILRKAFGRTRLIVPRDVGLKINFSGITASIIFEQQRYQLTGENFRWESPAYHQAPRRIKLMLSVIAGDVEVIIL